MRRRFSKRMPAWVPGLLVLATGCTSTAPSDYVLPPAGDESGRANTSYKCQVPLNEERLIDELLDRVRIERDRAGLPPLELSEMLSQVADGYACEMIEGKFFAHVNPYTGSSPGQRVTANGYLFIAVGENLAAGQRTAADVVEQWMDSPSHRANILGSTWRETGIAVRSGGQYGVYWVQIFADPVELQEPSPTEVPNVMMIFPVR